MDAKIVSKIVSKTELMQKVIKGEGHESFTHSEEGRFDITLMRAWAKANLTYALISLTDIMPFVLTTRVFEEARLADLDPSDLHNDPALVVLYERKDGERTVTDHLFIDGTHRAIRLHREGYTTQRAYLIPEANIIRPDMAQVEDNIFDWGDTIVNGNIVKRT